MTDGPVRVSGYHARADQPGTLEFTVTVVHSEFSKLTPPAIMQAIAEAVGKYVYEHHAQTLYAALGAILTTKVANAIAQDVIKLVDREAVAAIAAIHAGKAIGKEIGH